MLTNKTISNYHVTVNEVKKQLNIDTSYTDDDSYIQALIEAASDYISGEINADVEVTTNNITISDCNDYLMISDAPLIEVIEVKLNDIPVVNYKVIRSWTGFYLTLPEGGNLDMTFTTGYAELPAGLRQSIIIKAAGLYDPERSEIVVGASIVNTGVIKSLVRKYVRRYW